jgi:hypothetical protein
MESVSFLPGFRNLHSIRSALSLTLPLDDGISVRANLLKWSFIFWVGQVAAIAGLLAFMLRASGR